jgi:hypothetical protein
VCVCEPCSIRQPSSMIADCLTVDHLSQSSCPASALLRPCENSIQTARYRPYAPTALSSDGHRKSSCLVDEPIRCRPDSAAGKLRLLLVQKELNFPILLHASPDMLTPAIHAHDLHIAPPHTMERRFDTSPNEAFINDDLVCSSPVRIHDNSPCSRKIAQSLRWYRGRGITRVRRKET